MKTLFANNETLSFDVLTAEELAMVKGGKADDVFADLN